MKAEAQIQRPPPNSTQKYFRFSLLLLQPSTGGLIKATQVPFSFAL
jgi:hypothetical protein